MDNSVAHLSEHATSKNCCVLGPDSYLAVIIPIQQRNNLISYNNILTKRHFHYIFPKVSYFVVITRLLSRSCIVA